MLARDVNKITAYYAQYAPDLIDTRYAKEIWALYEDGELHPDTQLTGEFNETIQAADVDAVQQAIIAALAEEQERQERLRQARDLD